MDKHVSNLEGEIFRLRSELNALGDVMRHHMERAERAEAEIDALRKDSERYRWLRGSPSDICDAIIDAAMQDAK